ncbi:MAG: CDP-alcohol phosphatidyltransferase family protein [Gammaproteobacteria bacterium]|nr:CDP-alcohol phosphatidyltransferase family protein [Gammaproteobacteria bacterium]MDH3750768.1 CDP-alcohol phosphatidyltransferase family protein [Gammaproteobacteria bacterium]MDH3806583.1 CDP-alcohol phosphatidyltransferase family protein [Gammaproteobacteria bacterium]
MDYSWIPNAISIMRIVLILPILLLFVRDEFGWALALFSIAGLSDGIDGYVAKKYGWETRLGAFLDPAGDKLLVAWSFGTLAFLGHIPVWLAVIVILRDVVIVAGSFMYHYLVRRLEGDPTFISKLNTGLEFAFLIFVMSRAGFGWWDDITITIVGAAVLVTVVISGYDYVSSWIRSARIEA